MEREITITQDKKGLGKECPETPGKWKMEPEVCNANRVCPTTDPPEAPDETTDGPGGIGGRSGFGGKALFINDITLPAGGGCKMMPSFMNILY